MNTDCISMTLLAEVVVYLFTLSLGALSSSLPTLINIVAGDG